MGDLETALGIATAVRERYPESGDGDVVMAEILWRMKKPAEAAATLAAARKRFGASTMAVQAAPAFVRVYLRGNPEEAKLAFGELVSRKFVWSNDLEPIVDGIRSGGEPGRALQLLEKARGEGAEGAGLVLEGYELACEVSGRDEGLQWLRRRVPQPNQQFAIVAFQLGYHSLLWDLFPNPEVEKQPEILLLRAAALVSDGRSRTDSRWRETEAALSAASKESEFASEARYLMGMTGREAVLRIAGRGRGKLCTAAWALGLRAAADGHFREASDWLQISVESGTMAEPPFAFSWDLLLLWHAANRFLPTAAEQKGLVLYRRPTEREATASTR
jgi:hypothetical protein